MNNFKYIISLGDIDILIYIIKNFIVYIGTYLLFLHILNIRPLLGKKIIVISPLIIILSIIGGFFSYNIDNFSSFLLVFFFLCLINSIFTKTTFGYTVLVTIISLGINYIIAFVSTIISFIPSAIIFPLNDYVSLTLIVFSYIIFLYFIFHIKKINKGFSFLNRGVNNDYFEILILNISISLIFTYLLLNNHNSYFILILVECFIISSIIMFLSIKKSIILYYKHNLLVKDLNETKSELEKKNEEILKLEQENIELNKKNHSIAHKQKALEYKINEIIGNSEFSSELSIANKAKEISDELISSPIEITLPKTGIENIDDMLSFMQSECTKNNIIFELQLNGNIHHMVNRYISKEKLEILLADHIKNAIIAINSSDNINKSILVKLGIFDGIYSVYFYDSGIEFKKETLEPLGKTPITTHKDTGGTGFGFMNTFDTLKEAKASIEINHIGAPSKDNYTKCIIIRFDNKNEVKLK